MSELQSVRLNENILVGGGHTDILKGDDDEHTVYQYHPPTDKWVALPRYKYKWFAMTILTNKLTLVGGYNKSTGQESDQIAMLETEGTSRRWTHPAYPPMPTARHSPAVASYDRWLVVAGGRQHYLLTTVEVLDTASCQWLSASPLPQACRNMTSIIVNEELFLIGGSLTTNALVVSLPDITQCSATANTSAQWRTFATPPLEHSAAIAYCGSVLAIGGCHGNVHSTAIHIYQPATNNWKKVGDLPSPRSECSCTLLSKGGIVVAGGFDSSDKLSSRADAVVVTSPHS